MTDNNSNQGPDNGSARASRRHVVKPKARLLIAKMRDWLEDESGYDEDTWPRLKAALEADRLSTRSLFHG